MHHDAELLLDADDELQEGEELDLAASRAWALVDHQFAHVFVRDRDEAVIGKVVDLFRRQPGIAEVLAGNERSKYAMDHERSGDVLLISTPNSWQAYYWWLDDAHAPPFARTVNIHRKPGYDPVELFVDAKTGNTPLDATLIQGSHGQLATEAAREGVLISSEPADWFSGRDRGIRDTDVKSLIESQFGLT